MRQPAEYFDDVEVVLIHIAGTLRGALRLERLLTETRIPYAVETDTYVSGLLIPTKKVGAFFYVSEADAERASDLLRRNRFRVQDFPR